MVPRKQLYRGPRVRRRVSESEATEKRPRLSPSSTMENGDLHENDLLELQGNDPNRLGLRHWIDRSELLRLIEQTLDALGYDQIARQLEDVSEVKQEGNQVVRLRASILKGEWERAIDLLRQLPLTTEEQLKKAQFLILEEKFLEVILLMFET